MPRLGFPHAITLVLAWTGILASDAAVTFGQADRSDRPAEARQSMGLGLAPDEFDDWPIDGVVLASYSESAPAPSMLAPLPPLPAPVGAPPPEPRPLPSPLKSAPQLASLAQPIADPAIETVDEQTGPINSTPSGSGVGGDGSPVVDYWNQIKDPAIVTVDQQTHGAGGKKEKDKKWYDRLNLRGYAQFRFNQLMDIDPRSTAEQLHPGDASIADNQTFLIRRARVILSGDVSDHFFVYIQPDFAANVPGSPDANQYTQLRDCYGDVYFDDNKIHRLRLGQSKVPYGWENLQSSSNRVPLDRADGLNTAVRNERDLGLFYYYTPEYAQDLFKYVLDEGLKGSGNYGMFGVGLYNGQGGSLREQNDRVHVVSRFTVPYQLSNDQIIEASIQGYTGDYVVLTAPINPLGIGPAAAPTVDPEGYLDQRVASTFIVYPQPIGFQFEWNVGRGPALNDAQTEVVDRSLYGGYAMVLAKYETEKCGVIYPFAKYAIYRGGYKSERNAPYGSYQDVEVGLEWQFNPQCELTAEFLFTDRTNTTAFTTGESYGQFIGSLFRVQFQMNF